LIICIGNLELKNLVSNTHFLPENEDDALSQPEPEFLKNLDQKGYRQEKSDHDQQQQSSGKAE
jgi:hypothetical protein